MKNSEVRKGSLYELGYFETPEEATYWLELFAVEKHSLILPGYQDLKDVTRRLSGSAEAGKLTVREVLIGFQYLCERHWIMNVFCGWNTNSDKRCGGTAYQEMASTGSYYQWTLDPDHRTPVQRTVSDANNMTVESFWEMLSP